MNIPSDDKRLLTVACSKYCASNMRPFNSVNGDEFRQLCQALFDLGYRYDLARLTKPTLDVLLPDRAAVPCTITQIAHKHHT